MHDMQLLSAFFFQSIIGKNKEERQENQPLVSVTRKETTVSGGGCLGTRSCPWFLRCLSVRSADIIYSDFIGISCAYHDGFGQHIRQLIEDTWLLLFACWTVCAIRMSIRSYSRSQYEGLSKISRRRPLGDFPGITKGM